MDLQKTQKHGSSRKVKQKRRIVPRGIAYKIALMVMALVVVALYAMIILVDLLPADLTIIIAIGVLVILMLISFLFASRKRWKRIVGIVLSLAFVVALGFVTNFMWSTYGMLSSMGSSAMTTVGPAAKGVKVSEEPFNIYLTGIDQWDNEKGLDMERSDVNMILTVNPTTKKVLLTSIPRDTYVKLHTAQKMDKLTHSGVYGVDETLSTVEDWLGIDLNYYVKMNFSGAQKIINAMDGIAVYSPVAFESSLKGYKYKKGWNALGGNAALYFARERKAFEGQDAIRVENQQRVLEAIIKKMTSKHTLLTKYSKIMEVLGDNISTNMYVSDMSELAKMQLTDMSEWDIETQKVVGSYDMDYVASLTQSQKFSVYKADPKSVSKCLKKIDEVMNPARSDLGSAVKKRSKSFIINVLSSAIDRLVNKD